MAGRFWVTMLLSALSMLAVAEPVTMERLAKIDMPIVVVETDGGEEPDCEYLRVEDGFPGNTIRNATKVPGRTLVLWHNDTLYDSGSYEKGVSGMTVKIRGNNSAFRVQKPYKLKLQAKADMLCRGDEKNYKDKDWLLLNGTTLNTMVGMKVSELLKLQYTPAFRYVNVVFNGDYRGTYILSESVKRNPDCRLNVSKTEGYIVECDPYWWNEEVYFPSLVTRLKYTFKYPAPDDITEEQIAYAQNRIADFERSVFNHTYDNQINVESFATWLLAHEILGTYDAGGSNIYLTWYDNSSKIEMGNIWDLDTNYMVGDNWACIHEWTGFFFPAMLKSTSNTALAEMLLSKWQEKSPWLFPELDYWLVSYLMSDECTAMEQSWECNRMRYGYPDTTVADEVDKARQWLARRQGWLDNAMDELLPLETGIGHTRSETIQKGQSFNLLGQRAQAHAKGKGLRIHRGHLMLEK